MSNTFLLYLVTRLDSIKVFMTIVTIFLALVAASAITIYFLEVGYNGWNSDDSELKAAVRLLIISSIVATTITVLVPTQKDMMVIIGGGALLSAAKDQKIGETTEKMYRLLQMKLDEELTKGEKK